MKKAKLPRLCCSDLDVLKKSGIVYMLGGAIAIWPWGELRSIQDVDLVIHLKAEQVARLSKELEKVGIFIPRRSLRRSFLIPEAIYRSMQFMDLAAAIKQR